MNVFEGFALGRGLRILIVRGRKQRVFNLVFLELIGHLSVKELKQQTVVWEERWK
jgi:hypothetical protein